MCIKSNPQTNHQLSTVLKLALRVQRAPHAAYPQQNETVEQACARGQYSRETNRIRNLYDPAAREYEQAVKAKDTDAARKLKIKMLF
jgi:hypothetical protein